MIKPKRPLLLFLLLAICPAVAQAQFTTTPDGSGGLVITEYTGSPGAVVVPSTINGLTVTAIGDNAFSSAYPGNGFEVTSVTIPASVKSIGNGAFAYDAALQSVTLNSGLTTIGFGAFYACTDLLSLTIPATVTSIGGNPCGGCTHLPTITVSAQNSAFISVSGVLFDKNQTTLIQYPAGNTSNTSYTIPATVTSIGLYAFSNCSSLRAITVPTGMTTIGAGAFYRCSDLSSITIPANVTSIGSGAFTYCSSLSNFAVSSQNTTYSSIAGVLFDKSGTTLMLFPAYYSSNNYLIPNTTTTISDDAFAFTQTLVDVTIPASVTTIGLGAFQDSQLKKAVFLGNAPSMGLSVFSSVASGFTVYYLSGATGFSTPKWTDSSGDVYSTIALAMQSITFAAIPTQVFPSSAINLTATASSGLPVSFTLVSGPATISGNILTITGTGTITIQANQMGNNTYASATPVQQSFAVSQVMSVSAWQSNYSITNLTATPLNDGVPNLFKYLYDINPTRAMSATDRSALPAVSIDSTTTPGTKCLALTFRQYALKTGITVELQTSSDLQSWTTVTPDVNKQIGVDPNTNNPIMEIGVTVATGVAKQFIRLTVTQP